MDTLVVFSLSGQLFALPLDRVERVVRLVAITPLPQAPRAVCGVVNVQGQVIPVLDVRYRFRLPDRALLLSDQLLLVHTAAWRLAMVVDAVTEVLPCGPQDLRLADTLFPGVAYLAGTVTSPAGIVLLQDLDAFLAQDEVYALQQALRGHAQAAAEAQAP